MTTTPITISIPHQLGRAEARRRIDTGFANMLRSFPGAGSGGGTQRWDGDRMDFSVAALGQSVTGTVTVDDAVVTMAFVLPGLLGMLAARLRGRLQDAGRLLLTRK